MRYPTPCWLNMRAGLASLPPSMRRRFLTKMRTRFAPAAVTLGPDPAQQRVEGHDPSRVEWKHADARPGSGEPTALKRFCSNSEHLAAEFASNRIGLRSECTQSVRAEGVQVGCGLGDYGPGFTRDNWIYREQ